MRRTNWRKHKRRANKWLLYWTRARYICLLMIFYQTRTNTRTFIVTEIPRRTRYICPLMIFHQKKNKHNINNSNRNAKKESLVEFINFCRKRKCCVSVWTTSNCAHIKPPWWVFVVHYAGPDEDQVVCTVLNFVHRLYACLLT